MELREPALAKKVALVWPEPRVTLEGTVIAELALESETDVLELGAPDNVTVQVEVPGAANVEGEQLSELGWMFTVSVIVVDLLTLLKVAVTVAVPEAEIVPVVAVNVALL